MNPGAAIVVFILIWWCVFFAVLPFGVRPDDSGVAGADPGAPADPQLKKKALLTTGVAFVIWILAVALIMSGVINFRD
ncbi:MAG: DUF1467 family protein [Pseudomonadota bacterium]